LVAPDSYIQITLVVSLLADFLNMRLLSAFVFAAIAAARPSEQGDFNATNDYWVFLKASNERGGAKALEESHNLNVLERASFAGMEAIKVNINNPTFEKLKNNPGVSFPYIQTNF
jgi:hypothetical protein